MKKLLLILLSLIMCLSVFASCGEKDDTSSLSPESKNEESSQVTSESSEESNTDISEGVSENESVSIDNGSSEDESNGSNEVSNEDTDNKSDEDKNVSSSKQPSKYYEGGYTLDINTYVSTYGNVCEIYSYTGKNNGDSLIDILKDTSVSDDTVLYLGESYNAIPMDDELYKQLHENVEVEKSTPYVRDWNGVFESVIPSDEDWLNRTREIVGKADLSDYCVSQYSKIPYFMSVGYYTVGSLREMVENDTITFYFTRLPEPEKGEMWLAALPECNDKNCEVHK